MNKFTLAFALGTGLTLSLATPPVNADPIINTLSTPTISKADFESAFTPISNATASGLANSGASTFQLYSGDSPTPVTGTMQSEVFKGTGTYDGLYAYAYQVSVTPGTTDMAGAAGHIDGTSFIFNGTPTMADLTGSGTKSAAYLVTGGPIGDMKAPTSSTAIAPDSLSWQADPTGPGAKTYTGTLRANFVNTGSSTPPLYSGNDSATFVVLTNHSFAQSFVNVTSNTPQIGGMTSVYAADGTVVSPSPVPEPSTIFAWAGMAGALAVVRRVRKSRTPLA